MRIAGVPVSVNEESGFSFALDTGATATTLTAELAERLGLEVYSKPRMLSTSVGGMPTKYALINVLRVGAVEFHNEEVFVMDLHRMRPGMVRDGVLGHSMLKQCTMILDYASQNLVLSQEPEVHRSGWNDFKYAKNSHLFTLPTRINGSRPYDFILDTGAGSTVITPGLADSLDLDVQSVQGIARGLGGDTELKLTQIRNLSVNELELQDIQAAVIDMSRVSPKGSLIENGILGVNFLDKCELSIDYPQQMYRLKPRKAK
jgi:predicted aspartyl protease